MEQRQGFSVQTEQGAVQDPKHRVRPGETARCTARRHSPATDSSRHLDFETGSTQYIYPGDTEGDSSELRSAWAQATPCLAATLRAAAVNSRLSETATSGL